MSTPHSPYELEYAQVNDNIRTLADIRFRLLALIPPLGGVAIFLLTQAALTRPSNPPAPEPGVNDYSLVFLLSLMGFLATLGVTFYDLRNSELYDALIGRAKRLERILKMAGGQFRTRPERHRHLLGIVLIWHDLGLSLIYGTVLGAWVFPLTFSGLRWAHLKWPDTFGWVNSLNTALLMSFVMGLVFVEEFLRLDGVWGQLRDWAHKLLFRDKASRDEVTLHKTLAAIRRALSAYKAEHGTGPADLNDLVAGGYLERLPDDPVANTQWLCEHGEAAQGAAPRITYVRSSSDERSSWKCRAYTKKAGEPYGQW
jgi:hypothetical protein